VKRLLRTCLGGRLPLIMRDSAFPQGPNLHRLVPPSATLPGVGIGSLSSRCAETPVTFLPRRGVTSCVRVAPLEAAGVPPRRVPAGPGLAAEEGRALASEGLGDGRADAPRIEAWIAGRG